MDHGDLPAATDLHTTWLACMRRGDFAGAWAVSARVLAGHDPATRDDPRLPYHQRWVWDGRPFGGKHVLVRCYHGLGDTLMFARFLPLLRQEAVSVTLECQPELVPMLRAEPGVDRLVPFNLAAPLPPADCDMEIMELSFALRTPPDAVPPPYLSLPGACPSPAGAWEGENAPGTPGEALSSSKPRIGLCWQAGSWDRERVIPPALLQPIAKAWPCVSLVPGATDLPVGNPEGCPTAVADTAELIAGLDLVVTVDTMVAHLSGALGRPTWLLLKHEADWRWMAGRDASPWYPTMRLYRQSAPGDWEGVLGRVMADLERRPHLSSRTKHGDRAGIGTGTGSPAAWLATAAEPPRYGGQKDGG